VEHGGCWFAGSSSVPGSGPAGMALSPHPSSPSRGVFPVAPHAAPAQQARPRGAAKVGITGITKGEKKNHKTK